MINLGWKLATKLLMTKINPVSHIVDSILIAGHYVKLVHFQTVTLTLIADLKLEGIALSVGD
jgi:hypothetical protein